MIETIEYCLIGIGVGTVCGVCIGFCSVIIKHYEDSKAHKTDVENITKNILHTLDEETGNKENYMKSRPIV
jgi:hypothetical protein